MHSRVMTGHALKKSAAYPQSGISEAAGCFNLPSDMIGSAPDPVPKPNC
jgi:hypothetical protein